MFKGIDPEQRKALLLALGGVLLLLVGFAVFHKRALAVAPPVAGAGASASSSDSSGLASGPGLDSTGAPTTYNAAPTVYQTTYNYPGPGTGPASNPYGQPVPGAYVTDSSGSVTGAKFFAYSGVQAHRPGAIVLSPGAMPAGNLAAAPLPYGR